MDGCSKVIQQHPVWKAATLIGGGKRKSAQRTEFMMFSPVFGVLPTCRQWTVACPYG